MKNFQSCYDKYDPRRTFCPNPITTDFHLVILNVTIDCNLYDSIVMIKTAQTLDQFWHSTSLILSHSAPHDLTALITRLC